MTERNVLRLSSNIIREIYDSKNNHMACEISYISNSNYPSNINFSCYQQGEIKIINTDENREMNFISLGSDKNREGEILGWRFLSSDKKTTLLIIND